MVAEDILRFALYKEVLKRDRNLKKRRLNEGEARRRGAHGSDAEESESDSEDEEDEGTQRQEQQQQQQLPVKGKSVDRDLAKDATWGDGSQDVDMDGATQVQEPPAVVPAGPTEDGGIRPER